MILIFWYLLTINHQNQSRRTKKSDLKPRIRQTNTEMDSSEGSMDRPRSESELQTNKSSLFGPIRLNEVLPN